MMNVEWDWKWHQPQPAQIAALQLVKRRVALEKYQVSAREAAEVIATAQTTFWYRQLQVWAIAAPPVVIGSYRQIWESGAAYLLAIIDCGYDGTTWWNVTTVRRDSFVLDSANLLEFATMVHQGQEKRLLVTDRGLLIAFDIILGKGWETRQQRVLERIRGKHHA